MESSPAVASKPSPREPARADAQALLTPLERAQMAFIKNSLRPGPLDRTFRFLQKNIGARWINASTSNLLHVHGLERLPPLPPYQSFVCVSNHRSFHDMYVIASFLVARGLPHRLLFPVRSTFFYDNPLGPFVNFAMSFFAMYPPIFRDPKKAALNLQSLDEMVRLLRGGGMFVGLHPEGARKKDGDPYTFLPAQPGVGRVIHNARVPVLPVFVNGLGDSIKRQVSSNLTRKGPDVDLVFGAPVELGDLYDLPPSPRAYKRVSERALDAIAALSLEERKHRTAREADQPRA